jgi:hypothetical protein
VASYHANSTNKQTNKQTVLLLITMSTNPDFWLHIAPDYIAKFEVKVFKTYVNGPSSARCLHNKVRYLCAFCDSMRVEHMSFCAPICVATTARCLYNKVIYFRGFCGSGLWVELYFSI